MKSKIPEIRRCNARDTRERGERLEDSKSSKYNPYQRTSEKALSLQALKNSRDLLAKMVAQAQKKPQVDAEKAASGRRKSRKWTLKG